MTKFADLSGIVLAAGSSSRMEGANKLLLPWQKQCVLQVVVERVCEVDLGEVVVVTGHQRVEVEEALSRYPVRLIHNPDFAEGMAASIRVGVEASHRRERVSLCPRRYAADSWYDGAKSRRGVKK